MERSVPTSATKRRLLILGESPGQEELDQGKPFVGSSGKLLREQLFPEAGLNIDDWHITNVFSSRPPSNDFKNWTVNKTEAKKLNIPLLGSPIDKRWLLPHVWKQVEATKEYINDLEPELIICLGGKALWLLSGDSRIGTFRGTFFKGHISGARCIASYHPAAVLREWSFRPIVWADLGKVKDYLDGTLSPPLTRKFYINPSWEEIARVHRAFADDPKALLGVDIETAPGCDQITTISFSTPTLGICIPIWDKATGRNVYPTTAEEVRAWRWIDRYAQLANPKVMQNGMYDMQYLMDAPIDIRCRNVAHDTAIMAHALQPELRKDLGTLGSIYLNEPSWKQMRSSAKGEKADD